MASASQFVEGSSVDWRGLATALVGGFATLYVYLVIDVVETVGGWITSVPERLAGYFGDLWAGYFSIPSRTMGAAFDAAGSFWGGLGPIGYVGSLLTAFLAVVIVSEVIRRYV